MTPRRRIVLVLAAVFASTGAAPHRTTNFVVHAPTDEIAERVGQWAEYYRKQKAVEWLGREMPNWPAPCPLHVKVTMSAPGGATHFRFDGGISQSMEISGPLDRLIASVLPHEVTHTVFAHYFRCPVPRWADEGGSVLSEDDVELENHNKLVRKIMNGGRQFPLRTLFTLRDYPPRHEQVMCLYAQGFSVAHYLVSRSDKHTYLKFVAHGMKNNLGNWDNAVRTFYGHKNVEELEQAWIQHMRETKGMTVIQIAQQKSRPQGPQATQVAQGQQPGAGQQAAQTLVRTTAPPSQPLQPTPIYRGVAAAGTEQGQRFGDATPTSRPGYLPEPAARAQPQPAAPQVRLGPVEFGPAPPGPVVVPGSVSPAGYPR